MESSVGFAYWPGLLGRSYCNYHYDPETLGDTLSTRYATRSYIGLRDDLDARYPCMTSRHHHQNQAVRRYSVRLYRLRLKGGCKGRLLLTWVRALENKLISPCMVRHGSCPGVSEISFYVWYSVQRTKRCKDTPTYYCSVHGY